MKVSGALMLALLLSSTVAAATEPVPVAVRQPGYMTLTPSLWSFFGIDLERDGEAYSTGFLAHRLDDLVLGSPAAERHATHAQIWAGLAVAFGAANAGLLGAEVYRDQVGRRAIGGLNSETLASLAFTSLLAAVVLQQLATVEIAASVNAYNDYATRDR